MADMSVDEITVKANRVIDESAASCERMLQMTEEVKNTGNKTLTMLDAQGEQLRNVKKELGQIEQDMKKAQGNLNELSKCCGLCLWPWNRVKFTKRDKRYKQGKEPKKSKWNVEQTAIHNRKAVSPESAPLSGPYINRIRNDEREDEIEKNLNHVGDSIAILKIMAVEMGNKISEHNQTIEEINNEVTDFTHDITAAERRARKLQ